MEAELLSGRAGYEHFVSMAMTIIVRIHTNLNLRLGTVESIFYL